MACEEDCTCFSCTVGDVRELPSAEEVRLLADTYEILLHNSNGVALISAIDPEIEPYIKTAMTICLIGGRIAEQRGLAHLSDDQFKKAAGGD